jgi:hypothetical protein
MPSLVQDGINRCGTARSEVGVLGIVVKEEPGFLPAERFGIWIEISHGCGTSFGIRYAAYE